jgi:HD-like signal output (HDOD) protein
MNTNHHDSAAAGMPSTPEASAASLAFLTRISNELNSGPLNLPCFPDIVPRVRQVLSDPNSTLKDVVKIISTEPRLTARLLQTANSAIFNQSNKPAFDVRNAVARLGHQAVQSITTVFAIQQMKAAPTLQPVLQQLSAVWERSIAVAAMCQTLAKQLSVPADKVFLTGLLHGIGHFYLIVRSVEASCEIKYSDLSRELIAEWHPQLGKAVLTKWGMEDIVCNAVGEQHNYTRQLTRSFDMTDVAIAGVALAESLLDFNGELVLCGGITAFERIDLDGDELKSILKHTEHSLETLRATLL